MNGLFCIVFTEEKTVLSITMNAGERDALIKAGWTDEKIGWYSDDAKTVPIWREHNPNALSCNHDYTANKGEHDALIKLGWKDENIGWYALRAK